MRDRDRHRRQHVRGVVFLVDGLVADHRPAGGLDHLDVEAVLLVEAHRLRHDDRRRAGDRDEADLEVLLLDRAALREHLGRGVEREELRDRGERGRGADRFEEGAARGVLRKHRPHHRGGNDALVAFVFTLDRRALQRRRGVPFMLDLADVAAARAAGAVQAALRIERIVERRHRHAPIVAAASKRRGDDDFAMGVPVQRGKAPRDSIENSMGCVSKRRASARLLGK